MTRTADKYVLHLQSGDLVWIDGHARRVQDVAQYEVSGWREPGAEVRFVDGTKKRYDRGYKSVRVVIPDAQEHNGRPDGILGCP